jgi:hypothetical protein
MSLAHPQLHAPGGAPRHLALPPAVTPPRGAGAGHARLGLLLACGHLYLGGVIAALLVGGVALLALAHAVYVGVLLVAAALAIVGLLDVKIEPPAGSPISPRTTPRLWQLVERIRRELDAPQLAGAVVVDANEAFVQEVPRFGPFTSRLHLAVGLPYILAQSPAGLEAVIAHELAHVSRRHGRWSAWTGRATQRWRRLASGLEARGHWTHRLFGPFLRRYVPALERAYAATSRMHEYAADQLAAGVAGRDALAGALVRSSLAPHALGEVWEGVERSPWFDEAPPSPYAWMRARLSSAPVADAEAWLADELTDVDSTWTHPTLAQRLAGIGVTELELPLGEPPPVTAADELGPEVDALVADADRRWRAWAGAAWSRARARALAAESRLEELRAIERPSADELRERGELTAAVLGDAAARPVFEELVLRRPDDAAGLLHLGAGRLADGEVEGLALLERAVAIDPHATPPAAAAAVAFCVRTDRLDEADRWRGRAVAYQALAAEAQSERSRVATADEVAPHDLAAATVEEAAAVLARHQVARAYLTRKRLRTFPADDPVFVVGVAMRYRAGRLERRRRLSADVQAIADEITPVLGGGRTWVVPLTRAYRQLFWRMSRVDGALVHGKGRWRDRCGRPLRLL